MKAFHARLASLAGLLNRPLFGTRVIPRDARVNPSLFSEDEFPVYCPDCSYLLRGLPEPVCPECGTPFDRGRLLVEEYVDRGSRASMWRRGEVRLLMVAYGGLFLCVLLHAASWLYFKHLASTARIGTTSTSAPPDRMALILSIRWLLSVLVLLIMVAAGVIALIKYRRTAAKRERILQAMQPEQPS